jgi:hypothetical protein
MMNGSETEQSIGQLLHTLYDTLLALARAESGKQAQ